MGQGGSGEGEKNEDYNQGESDAQDELLYGFLHVELLFESRNEGYDGQHKIDWVVLEKLACDFSA